MSGQRRDYRGPLFGPRVVDGKGDFVIDLDLKKRIANTLSLYEQKCDKLQLQIDTLKSVINQLIIAPGLHFTKDDHFSQLQAQLDTEFDAGIIEKKIKRLVQVIDKLEKKRIEKERSITHMMAQNAELISRIALKSQDKRAMSKLQKLLDSGSDQQLILAQMSDTLTLCVTSVLRELDDLKENAQSSKNLEINIRVNQSLQELLDHLSIPHDLDLKRSQIKVRLEKQLNSDNLTKVIDGLTELVVDAFNVEQNRFKGFLEQLTNQLQDFDIFLQSSAQNRGESSEESRQLEHAIQGDIEQIKSHMDTSTTIDELSGKIKLNLDAIGDSIKRYREKERQREDEYQQQVNGLKSKLQESEQNAEEIKSLLTYQKYRINHDSLTGLPNRESYDEFILESITRWQQTGNPISLAVADIDHFKRINDTFGHLAGDKVLKKVAAIFKSSIRGSDYIARFGGEEFVFIFEDTTSKQALAIVEKLRKSVQTCQFVYHDDKVDVTVSFGLTTIVEQDTIESLFMRADEALYKAKDAGRNRCSIL